MLCVTVYAYGTTIRVWYSKTYHTRMVRTVRVRYEIRVWYTTGVREKRMKFYFVGAYESLNRLCRYTRTKPWNETKLGRCVIYTL